MKILECSKEKFKPLEKQAYELVFKHNFDHASKRADKFLVMFDDDDKMVGFVSYFEINEWGCYIVSGGMLESCRGFATYSYFKAIMDKLKKYSHIQFETSNKNEAMIKLGMKLGFRIVGTIAYQHDIYLTMVREG